MSTALLCQELKENFQFIRDAYPAFMIESGEHPIIGVLMRPEGDHEADEYCRIIQEYINMFCFLNVIHPPLRFEWNKPLPVDQHYMISPLASEKKGRVFEACPSLVGGQREHNEPCVIYKDPAFEELYRESPSAIYKSGQLRDITSIAPVEYQKQYAVEVTLSSLIFRPFEKLRDELPREISVTLSSGEVHVVPYLYCQGYFGTLC